MSDLLVGARRVRRWAVIWLTALLVLAVPTTAFAAQTAVDPSGGSVGICQSASGVQELQSESDYLMVNRWSASTSRLHSRLSAAIWDDVPAKVQRNLSDSNLLSFGNSEWALAINLVQGATRFCISDQIGFRLDKAAGKIGTALNESGLLALCVVLGLVGLLWRARREGVNWSGVVRILITTAVFAVMVNGATRTTTTEFGAGSPGWVGSKLNATVSGLAAAPAKVLSDLSVSTLTPFDPKDPLSCGAYVKTLREKYDASFGPGTQAYTSTIPATLDSLWASAGLNVYVKAQFGANNPFGERVFCRQLEFNSNTTPAEHAALTGVSGMAATSVAFDTLSNDIIVDRSMVAWAACLPDGKGGWTTDTQWAAAGVKAEHCQIWATTSGDLGTESFNFEDSIASVVAATPNSPEVRDFVLSYHGQTDRSSSTYLFVYVLSGLVMLFLFGGLAMALYAAKLAMVFVLMLVMFVALRDLLRPSEDSALFGVVKQYWGMALYAFGVGAIIGLMAYMTAELSSAIGGGSLMWICWVAVCPVIVAWVVVYVLKNVFKAPHLFKPTSALKWGAAGGALGAGIGIGADRLLNRGSGIGRHMARSASRSVSDKMFGVGERNSGGFMNMLRRKGGTGGNAAAAGAALTGAAAGAAAASHRKQSKGSTEGVSESLEDALKTGAHVTPDLADDAQRAITEGQKLIDAQDRAARERAGGHDEATGGRTAKALNQVAMGVQSKVAGVRASVGRLHPARIKAAATPAAIRAAAGRAVMNPIHTARAVARPFVKPAKIAGLTVAAMSAPVAAAPLLAAGAAVYGVRRMQKRAQAKQGSPGHYTPAQTQAISAFLAHQRAQAQLAAQAQASAAAAAGATAATAAALDGGDVVVDDEGPRGSTGGD